MVVAHAPASGAPPEGDLTRVGRTFKIVAAYSDTGQPAQIAPGQTYTLTALYTDAERGAAIEDTLALYSWDGSQWVKEPGSVVDAANHTVTAWPDHFSLWTVLGETRRSFLPLIRRGY